MIRWAACRGWPGARIRLEFEDEAFALPGYGRRFDNATAKDHDLAALRVQFRSRAGRVHKIDQDSGEEEPERGGDAGTRRALRQMPTTPRSRKVPTMGSSSDSRKGR